MYYLSIDVANKSLAISFLKYNKINKEQIVNGLNDLNNDSIKLQIANLLNINYNLNNIINYHICEVIDLLPNKKVKNTNILERSKALKNYLTLLQIRLNNLIELNNINKIILLIEAQPSFNDKSRATFNQIIYEFSNNSIYKIKVMNAMYKNCIFFNKDLKHYYFIQKYSNNYTANKNHTKENFKYFLKEFNMLDKLKNIKKKNYDDIADSFMQIFAYIIIIKKEKLL